VARGLLLAWVLLAAGCSLTPIPDVTSNWSEPCDVKARLCAHEFTLAATNEASVELRGSFKADGWTNGVAMQRSGANWTATVDVPWSTPVQYKFYVDGSRWLLDPANPKTIVDTSNNTNSLMDGITCVKWTCQ